MHILAIGVSHHNTSIKWREWFYNIVQTVDFAVFTLEYMVLNTCNRVEIYCISDDLHAIEMFKGPVAGKIKTLYCLEGVDAIRHIMQVACGLNSMVLGELEILGQLKIAYKLAQEKQTVGKYLHRLLQNVFRLTKKIRQKTELSANPVSVASIAANLASQIFNDLTKSRVLVIGAGYVATVIIKNLLQKGSTDITVVNRSLQRAKKLMDMLAIPSTNYQNLHEIQDAVTKADIIIATASSALPLITKTMIEQAQSVRRLRPMYIIDLGVPRNVEKEVRHISELVYLSIDDLEGFAKENTSKRQNAVADVEAIIEAELNQFMAWYNMQAHLAPLCNLRTKFHNERDIAIDVALRQLGAGQEPAIVVKQLAHSLVNRLLHEPTVKLKAKLYERVLINKA